MINPCYDQKTHTDCPNRKAGCASTCEKWREYEKIRNQGYKEKYIRYLYSYNGKGYYGKKLKQDLDNRKNPRKHGGD